MVGAYQEILGDLHNLFGDTDSLDAMFDENNKLVLRNPKKGDTIKDVLGYVDFSEQMITDAYASQLDDSDLPMSERQMLMEIYRNSLKKVTYLEPRQKAEK